MAERDTKRRKSQQLQLSTKQKQTRKKWFLFFYHSSSIGNSVHGHKTVQ